MISASQVALTRSIRLVSSGVTSIFSAAPGAYGTGVGARIDAVDEQLKAGGGYDHNYVLRGTMGELRFAARVVGPSWLLLLAPQQLTVPSARTAQVWFAPALM